MNLRLMMLVLITNCITLFSQTYLSSDRELPKIGDKAPEIKLEEVFQTPNHAQISLRELKGKVVVLEFWATWCAPCIPAMDHLNNIAENFQGQPVQFIAISPEKAPDVERFLKNKPSKIWIGLDTDQSVFEDYRPAGIPHTVIVDKSGKIVAITFPENVTDKTIGDLLAGKSIDLPFKPYAVPVNESFEQLEEKLDAKMIYKAIMRPSESLSGMMKAYGPGSAFNGRRITFTAVWPLAILSQAYDMPLSRFIDESHLPQEGFDVDVIVPESNKDALIPTLRNLLLTGFDIAVDSAKLDMEVWILRPMAGVQTILRPSKADSASSEMRGPEIHAKKEPIQVLVDYVGIFKKEPVVDETGLKDTYDFGLKWTFSDPNTLDKALKELGLELVKDRRQINVSVVKPANNSTN